jgi:O-antigen/teichoic acid export membrane protein
VFPAAIGLGVVGPTLVRTALPPKWAAVAPMLVILSVIGVLRPVGWAIGSYLIACGRSRAVMGVMLVNVASLLGAMILLGRAFGPLAACFGVGVGFCAYALSFGAVLVRTEQVSAWSLIEAMAPPLYACAVMVAGVLATRTALAWAGIWIRGGNLVVEIVVGALTYAGVCLLVARPVVRDAAFLLRDTWSRRGSVAAVA